MPSKLVELNLQHVANSALAFLVNEVFRLMEAAIREFGLNRPRLRNDDFTPFDFYLHIVFGVCKFEHCDTDNKVEH